MKAIVVKQFGNLDYATLVDIDVPTPKDGEVLIKIKYIGVNPFDWKVVAYSGMAEQFGIAAPLVPGSEFSGVVESVGDNVSQFVFGDEVIGSLEGYGGAYAQYIVVNENNIVAKPREIDFRTAASLSFGGRTAHIAIFDHANLQPEEKILVHGASGGVGSMAIQLAKNIGAYVIATASSENTDMIKEIGADLVIDYQKDNFEEIVTNVDVVLDTVGGDVLTNSFKVLKKGGFLVSVTALPSEELKNKYNVNGSLAIVDAKKGRLEEIVKLVTNGKIKPLVERVFPIENVDQAFKLSMAGNRKGKILLAPNGDQ